MNASRLALGGAPSSNTPIRGVAVLLCAWVKSPATTSMKKMTKNPSHLVFGIADFRLPEKKFGENRFIRLCSYLSIQNLKYYLMTLSALASTFGGIVRPICFAVMRLITNSNLA